jgi:hypothetical protein
VSRFEKHNENGLWSFFIDGMQAAQPLCFSRMNQISYARVLDLHLQ